MQSEVGNVIVVLVCCLIMIILLVRYCTFRLEYLSYMNYLLQHVSSLL